MATWQFPVEIIPKCGSPLVGRCSNSDFAIAKTRLDHVMGQSTEIARGLFMWGEEAGNRIDVCASAGTIEEIRARIDARCIDRRFLDKLVSLVRWIDAQIVTEEGTAVAVDSKAILAALECSPSREFVENPTAYLSRLKNRNLSE